jgi:four helix bundle protein
MNEQIKKLEDSKLWKALYDFAVTVFEIAEELPKEEDFRAKYSMKYAAFSITQFSASAVGALDPRDIKWALSKVRSYLFEIKNTLKFGRSTNGTEVDPEMMLKIDYLVNELDKEINISTKNIPSWLEEMTTEPKELVKVKRK